MASAAKGIKVYERKKLRLDRLNWSQREMLLLGTTAVSQLKERLSRGQGPEDGPAKPLGKRWKAIKPRLGLKPYRDLRGSGFAFGNQLSRATKRKKTGKRFIGHMLDELKVRVVTDTTAKASVSSFAARQKAWVNQQREPFMVHSPRSQQVIQQRALEQARAKFDKLAKTTNA